MVFQTQVQDQKSPKGEAIGSAVAEGCVLDERGARSPARAWIVVMCKNGQEAVAKHELEDQARKGKLGLGFEVYLPLRLKDTKFGIVAHPFLPGYLFARVSARMADWRGVFGTRGVKGVLGMSQHRAVGLQDRVVEKIRAREEAGFVRLGLAPDEVEHAPPSGAAVKVDQLIDALFVERVDARRGLILYSFFNGRDSSAIVDLRRLSETS